MAFSAPWIFKDDFADKRNRDEDRKRARTDINEPARSPVMIETSSNEGGDMDVAAQGMVSLSSSGKTGRTDGSETHVDPWKLAKLRPFPETQNCIMPYMTRGSLTIAAGTTSTSVGSFAFRLNSIYDVMTATTYAADPTAAADTADGSVNLPLYQKYWSAYYRYWTVLSSHYKIRIWIDEVDEIETSVWVYHNGQQQPPLVTAGGTINVSDAIRETHRHARKLTLHNDPAAAGKSYYAKGIKFNGHYTPGNKTVVNDVSEDEFKETWHRVTEVPSLREVCTVIVQRSDMQRSIETANAFDVKYELELVYHVQWKDLIVAFQYPTEESDLAAVADYAAQTI